MTNTQRKVAKIVKSFSNHPTMPMPVAWLELECGHTACAKLKDESYSNWNRAHDDANHLIKPGDVVPECTECVRYAKALDKLRNPDVELSHSRFRTRDSRGIGKGDYYVYAVDNKSPTHCRLWVTIEATEEALQAIRSITTAPLSPTEKR